MANIDRDKLVSFLRVRYDVLTASRDTNAKMAGLQAMDGQEIAHYVAKHQSYETEMAWLSAMISQVVNNRDLEA